MTDSSKKMQSKNYVLNFRVLMLLKGAVKSKEEKNVVYCAFNNMRSLKFKAQPTNAFFSTINQIIGGSSQLPTLLSGLCSMI